MFELKKYRVVKSFNGYIVGQLVAFSGADAKKFADKICSLDALKVANKVANKVEKVETTENKEIVLDTKDVKDVKDTKETKKANKKRYYTKKEGKK